jgi:hypothetical protein
MSSVNWISVNDQMPKIDSVVLVYSEGFGIMYSSWTGNRWSLWWIPNNWSYASVSAVSKITHWAVEPVWDFNKKGN